MTNRFSAPPSAPIQTVDYKIAELLQRLMSLEAWRDSVQSSGAADPDARARLDALETDLEARVTSLEGRMNTAESTNSSQDSDIADHEIRISALESP